MTGFDELPKKSGLDATGGENRQCNKEIEVENG